MLLKFYADESYNNRTFNFGGWLGEESELDKLERQWDKRVEHERRKHGQLTRYHASDCSSRQNEYKDWTLSDQIQHTKKFHAIIARRRVMAVSFGLDMAALIRIWEDDKRDPLAAAYNLATRKLMMIIDRLVKRGQGNRVAIIHDHTTGHDGTILDAFNSLMDNKATGSRYSELFTTIAPMRWQDCTLLQPADMIAFDTFKLIDGSIHQPTTVRLRKSLEALLGKGVRVFPRYWGEQQIRHLHEQHLADKARRARLAE